MKSRQGWPLWYVHLNICAPVTVSSRDRLVVRTLRCGRSNPGSNPGHGTLFCTRVFARTDRLQVSGYNRITIAWPVTGHLHTAMEMKSSRHLDGNFLSLCQLIETTHLP